MPIIHDVLELRTKTEIEIYDLTSQIQERVATSGVSDGQVLIFSRHSTTAVAINEYEERLLKDIQAYLQKLAPVCDRYLHNDLHLRDVPPDEPENAHAHLMALTLSTSEVIPIMEGQLGLGTYQSILLFELDGPRQRTVYCQISGE